MVMEMKFMFIVEYEYVIGSSSWRHGVYVHGVYVHGVHVHGMHDGNAGDDY